MRMHDSISQSIRRVAIVFLGLFSILFIYISYLHIYDANELAGHALNRRSNEASARIERGQILDRKGNKLGYSEQEDAQYERVYPYNYVFAHILGYDSRRYGKAGLESSFNSYLTGLSSPEHRLGPVSKLWQPKVGNSILLTLDADIQKQAYRALGRWKGAVIVIEPKTGAILALASKPSFDPNTLDENWSEIAGRADSPLLNRAVQGLYPPGSVLKIMMAEAALTEKISDTKTIFTCEGALKIGSDYTLSEDNHKAHGKINLEDALAVSCNVTFGKIALELGRNRMASIFERYGFSQAVGSELQEVVSQVPDFSKLTDGELAQTGIGQGPFLTTPLRMAMLAASFANKGIIMKPYLVNKIVAPDGSTIKQYVPEKWLSPSKAAASDTVGRMMETVVSEGTGTGANINGLAVAGKTGTAENPHGQPHAWFIGFAPANNPAVAIAVILENAGSGGAVAAPVARQILESALR